MNRGPLQGIVFDWAGTLVDWGSFAPTQVLIDAFAGFGVSLSLPEARGPMGLAKWDHIHTLGQQPEIAARWREAQGHDMTREDVDALYARFMPLQIERVARYSSVIPGALELLASLRAQGLRIGSCSGYPRAVMTPLLAHARSQGLEVDHAVATDDLPPGGRPGPWMALANVIALGLSDVAACVKVDDTAPGILEGRAAGMWTVGLTLSGNEVGLTREELAALPADAVQALRQRAADKLLAAGAHAVIDSVADLPAVLADFNARLARGETP